MMKTANNTGGLSQSSKESRYSRSLRGDPFANTNDKIFTTKMQETIIPEVEDNDPNFTKYNLKTVGDFGEELLDRDILEKSFVLKRPEQNLSVMGMGDNIKVRPLKNKCNSIVQCKVPTREQRWACPNTGTYKRRNVGF